VNRLEILDDRPPIFIGAGIIKEPGHIKQIHDNELLAAVILGSFTDIPWDGNDAGGRYVVEHWDGDGKAYYNSIGLKNPGREAASVYLPDSISRMKDAGQLVFVSVTTLAQQNPVDVLPGMTEWALEMGADGVEINGSCPNISPDHPLLCFDPEQTASVSEAIRSRVGDEPLLSYKVSPMDRDKMEALVAGGMQWDVIDTMNTLPNMLSPTNPATDEPYIGVNGGRAGMSGPRVLFVARQNLEDWLVTANNEFDVISMGGIDVGAGVTSGEVNFRVQALGAVMAGGAQEFRKAGNLGMVVERWAHDYVFHQNNGNYPPLSGSL
jgi:dihydroorotate dehydrogenase